MNVHEFKSDPTKRRHTAYQNSLFSAVAPEYSTGEVLLGSAYRMLLRGMRDSEVDLDHVTVLPRDVPTQYGGEDLWKALLRRLEESKVHFEADNTAPLCHDS